MANPVKHEYIFRDGRDFEEVFVNVYRGDTGDAYGGRWSERDDAILNRGRAAYLLHIKPKEQS